jgi:signal transduction histidine kinase
LLEGTVTARIEEEKLTAMRGMFRNITQQRRNEERVRLYANIVEHAQLGFLVWEGSPADPPSYRLIAKNGAADRMLARLGMIALDAGFSEMPALLAAANLPDVIVQVHRTHSAMRLDDIEMGGTSISTAVFPLPGRFVGVAFEDVSQRRAVERLKDEFVSTVSHELRTPLTSIRGALGLVAGGVVGQLPEHAVELISIARSNTERLVRLINDILDLDKLDAGKLELHLGPVILSELLRSTVEQMRPLADEAGVELTSSMNGSLEIVADADRITQVVTNLLSNAIKFSPRDARVEVQAEAIPSGNVRISITDSGPGIADADKLRLFNRFQQLDSSDRRSKGGTGLGLAICKAIIEQHGGNIGVTSEVGQGSTFFFNLPMPRSP